MSQGALGAARVRRVWAGDGLQHAAYRGGILRGFRLPHSLFKKQNNRRRRKKKKKKKKKKMMKKNVVVFTCLYV